VPIDTSATRPAVSVLMLTQVYTPDEASVGQHLEDLGRALIARGCAVRVITADRGYTDPHQRFAHHETRFDVSIRRTVTLAAPKRSVVRRLIGGAVFSIGACWHVPLAARFDVLVISTSPPMAPLIGVVLARLRGARSVLWLTDINPDEAVAAGVLRRGSVVERLAQQWSRWALRHADVVITCDEQMRQRALDGGARADRLHVVPPWSVIDQPAPEADVATFRGSHGWTARRVVMYSGNHSPVHPLETLLRATVARPVRDPLQFAFVGGGSMKPTAAEWSTPNVSLLPYQPLASLPILLAAADVHVVSMGDAVHGIVHPSKFYGAIAAGRPVLLLGSEASAVGQIIVANRIGWVVPHGDLAAMQRALGEIANMPAAELAALGDRARATHRAHFDPSQVRARFIAAALGEQSA
jgi:glycosyltransferase involved in cell wall biosynthesis